MYQACDHQKYQRLLKPQVGKLSSWSNTEIQRRHHYNISIFDNSASSQHMESLALAQMIVFPVCSASASRCSLSRLAVSVNILYRTDIRDGDGQCWRLLHRSLDAFCLRCRLLHSQAQLILILICRLNPKLLILKNRKFFSSILPIKRNLLTYLDVLLVTSLTVGVFGQVFMSFCGQSGIWSVIPIIHIQKYTEVFENDEKIPIKTNPQCGGILIRLLVGPMHHHLGIFW